MRVTVKKWGNSASVRIPAAIIEAAHLKLDDVATAELNDVRAKILALISPEPQQ